MAEIDKKHRLIFSLRGLDYIAAMRLVQELGDQACCFALGLETFFTFGLRNISGILQKKGKGIFADLGLAADPRAAAEITKVLTGEIKVNYLSVQISAGKETLKAVKSSEGKALIFGQTIPWYFDENETSFNYGDPIRIRLEKNAHRAMSAGLAGVICRPEQLAYLNALKPGNGNKSVEKIVCPVLPSWRKAVSTAPKKILPGTRKLIVLKEPDPGERTLYIPPPARTCEHNSPRTNTDPANEFNGGLMSPDEAFRQGATAVIIDSSFFKDLPAEIGDPAKAAKRLWDEIDPFLST